MNKLKVLVKGLLASKLIASSEKGVKYSLTAKGVAGSLVLGLVALSDSQGWALPEAYWVELVDSALLVASALAVTWGLLRKLKNKVGK